MMEFTRLVALHSCYNHGAQGEPGGHGFKSGVQSAGFGSSGEGTLEEAQPDLRSVLTIVTTSARAPAGGVLSFGWDGIQTKSHQMHKRWNHWLNR